MSAFMIATITIKDREKFAEFPAKTQAVAAPYGAELVLRGQADQVLTGQPGDHRMVVIVRFPSREKIEAWYNSDEYQPLVRLREAASEMKITSYTTMS